MAETKPPSPSGALRFGIFQVNLAARELRKHGVRVRLPGQPFCILSMLLEKPGEIVTREEMRDRLWPSDTFVDFEHSLNSAIKKLRAALGDSPANSRYVETVPRVGYRFIAPTQHISAPVQVSQDTSVTSVSAGAPPDTRNGAGIRAWQIVLGIALIVAPSAYFAWSRLRSGPQPHKSTAAETIASAGGPGSMNPNMQPVSSPKSAEARELYLKGTYFWNERTMGGFHQAIEYFQQATKVDPNYAAAYAGLANSYTLLSAYSTVPATVYMSQARAAALRSLELDQNLADGHAALALIVQNQDWDWQTSEKEFQRAIELNPDYATGHQWYAEHLMWLGRFDEALQESERARNLDPLSPIIATDYGTILYYSRQYGRAIQQFRTVLRKNPTFLRASGALLYSYIEKGMFAEARSEAETSRRLYGDGPAYWTTLAYTYGRAGQLERARSEVEKLDKVSRQEQLSPLTMLWAHLGVGNKEDALADLEKAYSQHFNFITSLKVEPGLDPLRSDPRFQDLLRRVGLAASGSSGGGPKP